ncbi:MAG: hypothetical protein Tsb005_19350 [Gammaproteobacteria bacterium]
MKQFDALIQYLQNQLNIVENTEDYDPHLASQAIFNADDFAREQSDLNPSLLRAYHGMRSMLLLNRLHRIQGSHQSTNFTVPNIVLDNATIGNVPNSAVIDIDCSNLQAKDLVELAQQLKNHEIHSINFIKRNPNSDITDDMILQFVQGLQNVDYFGCDDSFACEAKLKQAASRNQLDRALYLTGKKSSVADDERFNTFFRIGSKSAVYGFNVYYTEKHFAPSNKIAPNRDIFTISALTSTALLGMGEQGVHFALQALRQAKATLRSQSYEPINFIVNTMLSKRQLGILTGAIDAERVTQNLAFSEFTIAVDLDLLASAEFKALFQVLSQVSGLTKVNLVFTELPKLSDAQADLQELAKIANFPVKFFVQDFAKEQNEFSHVEELQDFYQVLIPNIQQHNQRILTSYDVNVVGAEVSSESQINNNLESKHNPFKSAIPLMALVSKDPAVTAQLGNIVLPTVVEVSATQEQQVEQEQQVNQQQQVQINQQAQVNQEQQLQQEKSTADIEIAKDKLIDRKYFFSDNLYVGQVDTIKKYGHYDRDIVRLARTEYFANLPNSIKYFSQTAADILAKQLRRFGSLNIDNLPQGFLLKKTEFGELYLDYSVTHQHETNVFTPKLMEYPDKSQPILPLSVIEQRLQHANVSFATILEGTGLQPSQVNDLTSNYHSQLANLWLKYGEQGIKTLFSKISTIDARFASEQSSGNFPRFFIRHYLAHFNHWELLLDDPRFLSALDSINEFSETKYASLMRFLENSGASQHNLVDTLEAFNEFWQQLDILCQDQQLAVDNVFKPQWKAPNGINPVVAMERLLTILKNARHLAEQLTSLDEVSLNQYGQYYASKYEGLRIVTEELALDFDPLNDETTKTLSEEQAELEEEDQFEAPEVTGSPDFDQHRRLYAITLEELYSQLKASKGNAEYELHCLRYLAGRSEGVSYKKLFEAWNTYKNDKGLTDTVTNTGRELWRDTYTNDVLLTAILLTTHAEYTGNDADLFDLISQIRQTYSTTLSSHLILEQLFNSYQHGAFLNDKDGAVFVKALLGIEHGTTEYFLQENQSSQRINEFFTALAQDRTGLKLLLKIIGSQSQTSTNQDRNKQDGNKRLTWVSAVSSANQWRDNPKIASSYGHLLLPLAGLINGTKEDNYDPNAVVANAKRSIYQINKLIAVLEKDKDDKSKISSSDGLTEISESNHLEQVKTKLISALSPYLPEDLVKLDPTTSIEQQFTQLEELCDHALKSKEREVIVARKEIGTIKDTLKAYNQAVNQQANFAKVTAYLQQAADGHPAFHYAFMYIFNSLSALDFSNTAAALDEIAIQYQKALQALEEEGQYSPATKVFNHDLKGAIEGIILKHKWHTLKLVHDNFIFDAASETELKIFIANSIVNLEAKLVDLLPKQGIDYEAKHGYLKEQNSLQENSLAALEEILTALYQTYGEFLEENQPSFVADQIKNLRELKITLRIKELKSVYDKTQDKAVVKFLDTINTGLNQLGDLQSIGQYQILNSKLESVNTIISKLSLILKQDNVKNNLDVYQAIIEHYKFKNHTTNSLYQLIDLIEFLHEYDCHEVIDAISQASDASLYTLLIDRVKEFYEANLPFNFITNLVLLSKQEYQQPASTENNILSFIARIKQTFATNPKDPILHWLIQHYSIGVVALQQITKLSDILALQVNNEDPQLAVTQAAFINFLNKFFTVNKQGEAVFAKAELTSIYNYITQEITDETRRHQIMQIVVAADSARVASGIASKLNLTDASFSQLKLIQQLAQLQPKDFKQLYDYLTKFSITSQHLSKLLTNYSKNKTYSSIEELLLDNEKNPFGNRDIDKQYNDDARAEIVINTSQDMARGTVHSYAHRKQLMEAYQFVKGIGYDIPFFDGKPASQLTNAQIADYFHRLKNNPGDLTRFQIEMIGLALVREIGYRVTGEFPYSTQIIALIDSYMTHGSLNHGVISEIFTGEGKTWTDFIKLVVAYLCSDRCDYLTSSIPDCEVAIKKYGNVLTALNIPTNLKPLTSLSSETDFQADGFNISTPDQMQLYLAKQKVNGWYEKYDRKVVSVNFNEFDKVALDDDVQKRFSVQSNEVDPTLTRWIYSAINRYITHKDIATKIGWSAEDHVKALKNHLLAEASKHPGSSKVAIENISNTQLRTWIDAAILVNYWLKENYHYLIKSLDAPDSNGQQHAIYLLEGHRVNKELTLGMGMDQLLRAKLNDEQGKTHGYNFKIKPETRTIYGASSSNLIDYYLEKEGMFFGSTSTAGSESEVKEVQKRYPGLHFTKMTSHFQRNLVNRGEFFLNNEQEQFKAILKELQLTLLRNYKDSPFVPFKDIETAKRFFEFLQQELGNGNIQLFTGLEDEHAFLANAAQDGMISITTPALTRNSDIKKPKPAGANPNTDEYGRVVVIKTYIEDKRSDRQTEGRTDRQGVGGETVGFYNLEDLKLEYRENISHQKLGEIRQDLEHGKAKQRHQSNAIFDLQHHVENLLVQAFDAAKKQNSAITEQDFFLAGSYSRFLRESWSPFINHIEREYREALSSGEYNTNKFVSDVVVPAIDRFINDAIMPEHAIQPDENGLKQALTIAHEAQSSIPQQYYQPLNELLVILHQRLEAQFSQAKVAETEFFTAGSQTVFEQQAWHKFTKTIVDEYRRELKRDDFEPNNYIRVAVDKYNKMIAEHIQSDHQFTLDQTQLSDIKLRLPTLEDAATERSNRWVTKHTAIQPSVIAYHYAVDFNAPLQKQMENTPLSEEDTTKIKTEVRTKLQAVLTAKHDAKQTHNDYLHYMTTYPQHMKLIRETHAEELLKHYDQLADQSQHKSLWSRLFGQRSQLKQHVNNVETLLMFRLAAEHLSTASHQYDKSTEEMMISQELVILQKIAKTLLTEYRDTSWFISRSRRDAANDLITRIEEANDVMEIIELLTKAKDKAIEVDINNSSKPMHKFGLFPPSRFQSTVDTLLKLMVSLADQKRTDNQESSSATINHLEKTINDLQEKLKGQLKKDLPQQELRAVTNKLKYYEHKLNNYRDREVARTIMQSIDELMEAKTALEGPKATGQYNTTPTA